MCLATRLSTFLAADAAAALGTSCSSVHAHLAGAPETAVAVVFRSADSRLVLISRTDGRLPRTPLRAHASRACAVAQGQARLAQVCPRLGALTAFLAADLPPGPLRDRRCRTVAIPAHGPGPPPAAATGWTWVLSSTLSGKDAYFAYCALAATSSFCPASRHPPSPPPPPPVPAPAPPPPPEPPPDPSAGMAAVSARLQAALAASDSPFARSWADSVGRRDNEVLLATPPALRALDAAAADPCWRLQPLSARYEPPPTAPYVYPTNPAPPASFQPRCVADLWLPEAWARLTAWLDRHWSYLADCWRLGSDAVRGAIPTVVFTQTDLVPEARGIVWDTRGAVPVPLAFDSPIASHWNLAFLREALRDHPDRELVSFVTEGCASKTETRGLVTVLGPHLVSLCHAFPEVDATVGEFVALGWYDRLRVILPFTPCNSVPQGQTDKANGDKRRTSDFGFPRKPTSPPVASLNATARAAAWTPEIKPTVPQLANNMAVLRRAADIWGEDLILISDDIKAYFCQFRTHPSEWFKSAFAWLQDSSSGPLPCWIAEYVLGFGMTPSSGIAQRFSHALLWLLRQRFDAEEAALNAAETIPARVAHLAARAALGPAQDALYSADIFTDDSIFVVVGAERAARLLAAWGTLLADVNLLMAGSDKRQAGSTVKWNGVYSNAYLLNQIIPPDKALRALDTLGDIVNGGPVTFRRHQSLMGRIEHFRGVIAGRRSSTHGMYWQHAAGRENPHGLLAYAPELVARAHEWIDLLRHHPGRTCARSLAAPFSAAPFDPDASGQCFFAYTDAALLGAPVPGLGGYLHGRYFSFALPDDMLGYAIPQLEFLAIIAATLLFRPLLAGAVAVLVTDSITSFHVIANDGAHSPEMQFLHLELQRIIGAQPVFAETRHGYGETNPCADLASRGRLKELHELCAQLGVTPLRADLPSEFAEIV